MKRRRFIRVAGLASAGALFPGANQEALSGPRELARRSNGEILRAVLSSRSTREPLRKRGMRLLAEHLRKVYPDKKVIDYTQGCTYDWVTAREDGA